MAISIGVDIGGTFTDVVALETTTGELTVTKVPSTAPDYAEGFWQGINKIIKMAGASAGDIVRLIHGTTVATNSILEHKGTKIGVLTTEGFEGTLIMGRWFRSEMYNVFLEPETPTFLCPRHRIIGIKERLDPLGHVLIPLNESSVIEAVDSLVQRHGVQAIAVSYLFSYVNPVHEQRTEQVIRARYPNIRVSISSTVNPRFREYERTVITAFDAYVGPVMEKYI